MKLRARIAMLTAVLCVILTAGGAWGEYDTDWIIDVGAKPTTLTIKTSSGLGNWKTDWSKVPGLTGKMSDIKKIVITDDVNSGQITSVTFSECTGLVSLDIAGKVSIGANAFSARKGTLAEVKLTGVSGDIGASAFEDCALIGSGTGNPGLSIPNTVTKIGANAFKGVGGKVTDAVKLSFAGTDTTVSLDIGAESFRNAKIDWDTDAKFPARLRTLGINSFASTDIKKVNLGATAVTVIPESAFEGCVNITGVNLGAAKLETIGRNAFKDCTQIGNFMIPATVKTIGESAFENAASALTTATTLTFTVPAPDAAKPELTIGENAFKNARVNIGASTAIPARVASLGVGAFESSDVAGVLTIASTKLTVIPENCFKDCTYLTEATVAKTVTEIGKSAFENCVKLETLTIDANDPEKGGANDPDLTIANRAFAGAKLTGTDGVLDLPYRVASIGSDAFKAHADSLETLKFHRLEPPALVKNSVPSDVTVWMHDLYPQYVEAWVGALSNIGKIEGGVYVNDDNTNKYFPVTIISNAPEAKFEKKDLSDKAVLYGNVALMDKEAVLIADAGKGSGAFGGWDSAPESAIQFADPSAVSTDVKFDFGDGQIATITAVWGSAPKGLIVSVNPGTGGSGARINGESGLVKDGFKQGDKVAVDVIASGDAKFTGWNIVSPSSLTVTSSDKHIEFTMPDVNVSLTANWQGSPAPTPTPTPSDEPEEFKVTINGGGTGSGVTGGDGNGNFEQGDTVTIDAGTLSGFTFVEWTDRSGTLEPEDFSPSETSANATFTMPGKAIALSANWLPNAGGDNAYDALVGKGTPADRDLGSADGTSDKTVVIYAPVDSFVSAEDENGVVLRNGSDYMLTEGSTIFTLTKEYIAGLDEGKHDITLTFKNASNVPGSTVLTINKTADAPSSSEPSESESPDPSPSTDPRSGGGGGCDTGLGMFAMLALAGAAFRRSR